MKKSFKLILVASLAAFAAVGCAKQGDIEEVNGRIDKLEQRVTTLEEQVKQLNETDVPGLRSLVNGILNNITISSVIETEDGYLINFSDGSVATLRNGKDGIGRNGYDGVTILSIEESADGYLVTFSDGQKVFLKHGKDGIDGIDGKQIDVKQVDGVWVWTVNGEVLTDDKGNPIPVTGADGDTPKVSITLLDGIYVWTVNGEVLKDDAGKPIPVAGKDGTDGVTPQFGILDGHWVVSYDDGETWKTLGLVSDTDYSAYLDPDKETDDYIVLVVGATEVQIPKEKAFTLTFTTMEDNGINPGETLAFPYTISGVNPSDETDVDVIGILGDWTAEVVPANNAAGILKVTATETKNVKITVYAANHKGKTDIRTLVFEDAVLEAIVETRDITAEGGTLDLQVKTNRAYEVLVPAAAQSWISVDPVTRVHVDNYEITVAPNETGSYRSATLQVVNAEGESVKDIEILQYANPEAATDLASVAALPDDKAVALNQVTVVAASKVSTIVTDGKTFLYVADYTGTPGTVIDVTGTKKTDEMDLAFVEASEVKVNAEAEPVEVSTKDNYLYFGFGQNDFTYFYTVGNGIVSVSDGVYTISGVEEPQQFVFEDPTQDLSALVGKFVAFSGWVKAVDIANDAEDIITIVTDIQAVTFSEEPAWKVAYEGETSGESGYPEMITNTVSGSPDSYYTFAVYSYDSLEGFDSFEEFIAAASYEVSDDVLYYLSYYNQMYGLDYDTAFGYLAYDKSDYAAFRQFPYDKYIALAIGVDGEGRVSGKYAYTVFEKEDPSMKMAYEDFLGTWSVNGVEWKITQKENGVSYNIDGIPGSSSMASRGGNTTVVAQYDAENGTLYVMEQEMASYDDPSSNGYGPLKDYLSGYFTYYSSSYPNYPTNGNAAEIFSLAGYKDGTYEIRAGSCNYGTFNAFQFRWIIQTGSYAGQGNRYGSAISLPIKNVTKVNKVAGKYEDFLGTWTVGEDQWTVTAKKAGETYNLAGVYGSDKLYSGGVQAIEAGFDASTGEFYVMDQYLGQFNSDDIPAFAENPYGMCSDNVCGIFIYGSDAYPGYPNNGITTPGKILTGSLDPSGRVVLTPGNCMYGTYAALGFSWSILTGANAGKGNYYGNYVTELPATMVKASAGSSSVRTAKQEEKVTVKARISASSEKAIDSPKLAKPAMEKAGRRTAGRLMKF